jgi:transcriptional regulator with XRE-family HTH domain
MTFIHKIRQIQLIGPRIRKIRKERKLTQTELASRIGIQQSDLSRMEKGEYRVSLDTLFKILAEFDVSISEFFDDVAKEDMTPRDVKIMRDYKTLSADAQREVDAFIEFKRAQRSRAGADAPSFGAQVDDLDETGTG